MSKFEFVKPFGINLLCLYFKLGLAIKVGHDKGNELEECFGTQVC
jgi:hypothetical protein